MWTSCSGTSMHDDTAVLKEIRSAFSNISDDDRGMWSLDSMGPTESYFLCLGGEYGVAVPLDNLPPVDETFSDVRFAVRDFVTVGTPLACAVRGERMTLRADVSQRYYGRLGEVVSANFIPQYSDSPLNVTALGGKLVSVGQSSAENAFYVPVTFEFDGADGVIPGSFAEIWLLTAPRKNVISVPVSALTEEQGLYFVYLKMDESCYRKQEVALGESDGMRTEIISGLKAGDNVVVRGAYNVKLAGASNIIPAHTHNH